MIQFNDLKFLTSKTLHVNAEVIDLEYYDDVYIDSIIIDTEDTVSESGPSDNPPYVLSIGEKVKSVNKTIDVSELLADGQKMLFVYIRCTGVPTSDTPCGLDAQDTMQPVINYQAVYNAAYKLAKCVGKCGCLDGNCSIDTAFANFALQYFRMEQGLANGNWSDAYDAYCWLMHKYGNIKITQGNLTRGCNCNG